MISTQHSQSVRSIFEDHTGRIWIGTDQMVYLYNREQDLFEPVMDQAPFPVKGITGICEDKQGYFYFATWDRLIRYHPDEKELCAAYFSC